MPLVLVGTPSSASQIFISRDRRDSAHTVRTCQEFRFDNFPMHLTFFPTPVGVVAQLVERLNGIQEVRGSNPLGSTIPQISIEAENPSAFRCDHGVVPLRFPHDFHAGFAHPRQPKQSLLSISGDNTSHPASGGG